MPSPSILNLPAHEIGKVLKREKVGAYVFLSLSTTSRASCLLMSEMHEGGGQKGPAVACGHAGLYNTCSVDVLDELNPS